jgi:hypothetical protein
LAEEGSEMRGIHVVDHLPSGIVRKEDEDEGEDEDEEAKRAFFFLLEAELCDRVLGFLSVSLRPFFVIDKFNFNYFLIFDNTLPQLLFNIESKQRS